MSREQFKINEANNEQREILEKRLKNAAMVLRDYLKVKQGEKVLFVTDEDEFNTDTELIEILKKALGKDEIEFSQFLADDKKTTEKELLKAISGQDLVWLSWAMGESGVDFDELTKNITHRNGRMLFAPGLNAGHLDDESSLTENQAELTRRLDRMEARLKDAAGFHIASAYGTDLRIKMLLGERKWQKENGELNPGQWGNLPGGDIFAVPDEENINGVLVVPVLPEEVSRQQGVDELVRLEIRNGKIAKIDGGKSAEKLRKYLERCARDEQKNRRNPDNVVQITDIGFGANSKAKPVVAKEDGKFSDKANPSVDAFNRLGTMHIGIGSSIFDVPGVDGHTDSDCHLDFVLPRNGLTVKAFYRREDFEKNRNAERLIDEGRWRFVE